MMDKFKTVLNIANQQSSLGFGVVALLTAGGEQIFSTVVFRCPCNSYFNFVYGMVFLLVPALALLLLGYILSKKTWKLITGLCRSGERSCGCKKMSTAVYVLFQISISALVAPSSWIAVALLSGNYFECAMTGTNVNSYYSHLCEGTSDAVKCQEELFRFPCGQEKEVPEADRDKVLLTLRAHSQILGWLLIASIMLFNLLLTCLGRCTSPISYLQLKFWRVYAREESCLIDSYTTKHAKELAERNVMSFFTMSSPDDIQTPSNKDWERISSLFKFSSKKQYYSTLHCCVENHEELDSGKVRMQSVRSTDSATVNPQVLDFVDDGRMTL
ncbi:calcium homeostasis modulator protein 6 [Xyrichtys novacula]|uniref:Calcium homeostasis modulator protein 6 n=1 Tax=Xyrichtys novacula TaxID=13765 RepID=A0AAV1FKB2_XYRNO|nr:calcium homeostasis modulator protein 6 [Xyrichtys novacula]